MARCARQICARWRPDALVRRGGLGVRLDEQWYCSTPCLEVSVEERLALVVRAGRPAARRLAPAKLGVLLRAADHDLTSAMVDGALAAQRTSGRRLGDELRRMGAVAADDVLRALALQANTRYLTTIDPATVRPGHGHLSREMVRALGLVPFEVNDERQLLKVAYVAPLPRLGLAALRELTGWTPEPYLVDDDVWPALVETYGTGAPGLRALDATAGSLRDASVRIARAAEHGRDARIVHARIDPYLWVRVQTSEQVEDLLMPTLPVSEDLTCQTAPTSH